MRTNPSRFLLCGAILASLSSCGSMVGSSTQNSGPKTVTMDPMLAGKSLAESSFRATFVAAVRQPVTSARQGIAVLWHRPREIVAGNLPVDIEAKDALTESPGTAGFEKLLDKMGFPKPENGTLKWLVDGEGFFPELDRQIASARSSINTQIYIFDNDDIAFSDKAEVERLVAAVFTPDIARSRRIHIGETKAAHADLAEIFADQL